MVDSSVAGERESITCCHGDCLGVASSLTALVASQVVGFKINDRRVHVGILSDVLVHRVLGSSMAELVEDIYTQ